MHTVPNVDQRLATPAVRFFALFIDGLILGFIGAMLFRGGGAGGAVGIAIAAAYHAYFLSQHAGQTPGKMLLGLRVVKLDGTPITPAEGVIRYVGYIINSAALMLGWIWALFDERRQGWHDKFVGTIVVKA